MKKLDIFYFVSTFFVLIMVLAEPLSFMNLIICMVTSFGLGLYTAAVIAEYILKRYR